MQTLLTGSALDRRPVAWRGGPQPLEWTVDMAERADGELYLEAGRGNRAAFSALVARYTDELLGYFRRRVGDESAEDLLQETFLRLHKAAPRFVPQATFRTYLYTIARNLASNHHRDARPSVALDAETSAGAPGAAPDPLESAELSDRVRRAVDDLSEPLRDVVILRHYQGLAFRDIAEVLQIPEGTAMRRMSDALLQLRGRLGNL